MHRLALIRLLWCATGAAAGVVFALHLAAPPVSAFFLASLGGSSIFLFGLTRAPAAQPRALFGGHLGGAAIGIACYQAFGDAPWVYAFAEALALVFMLTTRTVHPPAGTNPILMVYVHAGWTSLFQPVFLGVAVLALTAALWSRLFPGLVHYPTSWFPRSPSQTLWGGWEEDVKNPAETDPALNPAPAVRAI